MNVSDCEGAELDYWVSRAEGKDATICDFASLGARCALTDGLGGVIDWYSPSRDWAVGGPIIERERINLTWDITPDNTWAATWVAYVEDSTKQSGATALLSAMRAFVASNFGQEIPDRQS